MVVSIDEKSVSLIKEILKEQNKEAIRIANCGFGCGGLQLDVIPDEQKPDDDVVIDKGIKIVADKSFSAFFTSALITHKEGILGSRLKIATKE
ncbi:adhesin [Petroclostridium sp. X23]|uniref:adhesin n=1 Tax=Petroclostridium sp. X23 TaxID=3045146 RepID=UPI0024AC993A|nr:adhesin [Petroclostridium sp. X23]WHH60724.1 adhesin [Petroclostridium sp. X23]